MKTNISKYFLSALLLLSCLKSHSQVSKIFNADSITVIYNKAFEFISSTLDTLKLNSFEDVRKNKTREIYFKTIDTSAIHDKFDGTPEYLPYKRILSELLADTMVKNIKPIANIASFSKFEGSMNSTNGVCFLLIYPIIRYADNVYLRINCISPATDKEPSVGILYLIFNRNLEIIYSKTKEVQ